MIRFIFFLLCLALAVIFWLEYSGVPDDQVEQTIREQSEQLGKEAARVVQEAREGLRDAAGKLHEDTQELRDDVSSARREAGETVENGAEELRDQTADADKKAEALRQKARALAKKAATQIQQRTEELREEYEKLKQRVTDEPDSGDKSSKEQ